MPNIDHHPPGDFCWIELATSDQAAAKSFYSALFGWHSNDMPMGPSEVYTIFRKDGRDAAAAYTIRPDDRAQGVPPHWMLYIAVQSVDDAAARAGQLGGKVIEPPFDVFDAGRMALIADPTGAILSLWQPKKNLGTGIAGVPGTLCWADLSTPDPDTAKRFYERLFEWKIAPGEHDHSGYLHIQNGEQFIGGIPPAGNRGAHSPPHWMPYFLVAGCDASTATAQQLGAKVYLAPMTLEKVGRFAVLADPEGAVFAIFQAV